MKLCSARSIWHRRNELTPTGGTTWQEWWEERWKDNYSDYVERMKQEKANGTS